jgi:hypothetical protein
MFGCTSVLGFAPAFIKKTANREMKKEVYTCESQEQGGEVC